MENGDGPTLADPQQIRTPAAGCSLSALQLRAGSAMKCLCDECGNSFEAEPQEMAAEHRLLVGDSTQAADVAKAMGRRQAALFATDPPYFIDYTGADRPNN